MCIEFFSQLPVFYLNYPKILYTKFSDKLVYANSADPDQTAPEGTLIRLLLKESDQGLHCLPFNQMLCETTALKICKDSVQTFETFTIILNVLNLTNSHCVGQIFDNSFRTLKENRV